ncbi:MAG: hypothetical protein PHT69_01780 [Bacteroidales bacterium]|nr:hypothetical protein [Bacteroidales bacterium]
MKLVKTNLITVLIIFFLGVLFHHNYISKFPEHIHAWAQSDRYAIALGFVDNGLNFFKPQTFVYPVSKGAPSATTVTSVDFPIHDYVPAIVMTLSGSKAPIIFRLYILLYSFLGLYFLFKLSLKITNDYYKSLFVLIFTATSPVFVYYQSGFLPTIPSLSNAIIGLYFYFIHLKNGNSKSFGLSLLFMTLATLARTTFAIPLTAILCIEILRVIVKKTIVFPKLYFIIFSLFIIISYYTYNAYLRTHYGTIFLNHLLPPSSFIHAKELIITAYNSWFFQYFSKFHYVSIMLIFGAIFLYRIASKGKTENRSYLFGLTVFTIFTGSCIFALLMLKQYPDHDYYFLDTFFLPLILGIPLLMSFLPKIEKTKFKIIAVLVLCVSSFLLIKQAIKSQKKRYETAHWDKTATTVHNFENASAFLDSAGIEKNADILVLDAVAPNIPFIMMERKGYFVLVTSAQNIEKALTWDFDYIVIQNEFFISDIYTPYPAILSKLEKIADNGNISVCRLCSENDQNLFNFFNLDDKAAVLKKFIDFENPDDFSWENIYSTDKIAFSGTNSGFMTSDITYGLTFKTSSLQELKTKERTLYLSANFLFETAPKSSEIVVSVSDNGENVFYKTHNLKLLVDKQNEWKNISLIYQLPKINGDNYELAVYLWNTEEAVYYYDDFSIEVY